MTWTRDLPTVPGWYAVHTGRSAGMFATLVVADVDTGKLWARDWEHDWFVIVDDEGWLWCKLEVPDMSVEVSG